MKNYHNQTATFPSTWLQKAGMICLTGMLCLACAPTTAPPNANQVKDQVTENNAATDTNAPTSVETTPGSSPPVQVAPATVPTNTPMNTPMNKPTTAANAVKDTCKVTMAIVSDPNPPTNVRSTPEVRDGNIIGQVQNRTQLSVQEEQNNWFKVRTLGNEPLEGWVSKNVTESGCNEKTQRITIPSNSNSVTIRDRFIGTGSHEYTISAQQGQTITVTANSGPFPFIFAASDVNRQRELSNQGGAPGPISWSSQISTSGDYVIDLESNFRGYEYSFTVELR
jgi:hypothetical protein